jgi:hypothetical protein
MLECRKNASPDIIRLPFDYLGPFKEVVDDSKLYTIGELIKTARVPRVLRLRHSDQRPSALTSSSEAVDERPWIDGIPTNFDGVVEMERPEFFVEVALVVDPDEDDEDMRLGPKLLVPIDSQIRVEPRESDYTVVSGQQLRLIELVRKKPSILPRIVRVVDWNEETTILKNHFVRPGQLFVAFERRLVAKLAVAAGRRRFFVPVTHGGHFRRLDSPGKSLIDLGQLPRSTRHLQSGAAAAAAAADIYPFSMRYQEDGDYVNLDDNLLPTDTSLRVDGVIEEDSLVMARISDDAVEQANMDDAFDVPLRTRLILHLCERLLRPVKRVFSVRNDFVEEVTEAIYNNVLFPPAVESASSVGYVLPQQRSTNDSNSPSPSTFRRTTEPAQEGPSTVPNRLEQRFRTVGVPNSDLPGNVRALTPPERKRRPSRTRVRDNPPASQVRSALSAHGSRCLMSSTTRRGGDGAVPSAGTAPTAPVQLRVPPSVMTTPEAVARQLKPTVPPRAPARRRSDTQGLYQSMQPWRLLPAYPVPAPRGNGQRPILSMSLTDSDDSDDYEIPYGPF